MFIVFTFERERGGLDLTSPPFPPVETSATIHECAHSVAIFSVGGNSTVLHLHIVDVASIAGLPPPRTGIPDHENQGHRIQGQSDFLWFPIEASGCNPQTLCACVCDKKPEHTGVCIPVDRAHACHPLITIGCVTLHNIRTLCDAIVANL